MITTALQQHPPVNAANVIKQLLAARIKELRKIQAMSQEKLADISCYDLLKPKKNVAKLAPHT